MKILITGASGFIGDYIITELKKKHKLACLVLPNEKLRNPDGIEIFVGDITKPDTLKEACAWPDIVLHVAGLNQAHEVENYYRVNEKGTKNMVDVLAKENPGLKLFVLFSSLSVAGPMESLEVPINESQEPSPIDHYGKSKLYGEKTLENAPFKYVILRLPSVYGGGSVEFIILMRLMKKQRIKPRMGSKGNYFSMIYVEDLAQVVAKLILNRSKLKHNVFYLAGKAGGHHTDEINTSISQLMPHKVFSFQVPIFLLKLIGFCTAVVSKITGKGFLLNPSQVTRLTSDFVCDPARFKSEFGIEKYTTLNEGMKRSHEWYEKEGWL